MSSLRSSTTSAPTLTTSINDHDTLDIEKKSSYSLTYCDTSSINLDDLATSPVTRCGTIVSRLTQFKKSVL